MQETQNTEIVQNAFVSFLAGDIASVMEFVDDSVVWKGTTGAHPDVPMAGVRHGRAAVAEFFQQVGAHIVFSGFEPETFVAQHDRVVVIGHYSGKTSVGGSFDSDFVMIFRLRDGRIIEFQEFLDVAQFNAAWAMVVA